MYVRARLLEQSTPLGAPKSQDIHSFDDRLHVATFKRPSSAQGQMSTWLGGYMICHHLRHRRHIFQPRGGPPVQAPQFGSESGGVPIWRMIIDMEGSPTCVGPSLAITGMEGAFIFQDPTLARAGSGPVGRQSSWSTIHGALPCLKFVYKLDE